MNLAPIARRMLREAYADQQQSRATLATSLHVEPDMLTPEGKTCGDCAHWPRCSALIGGLNPKNAFCDFAPSRFHFRRTDDGRAK